MIQSSIKKFTYFFIIFFSITNVSAENKTVYIDLNFLINSTNFGKKILTELDELNKKNTRSLEKRKEEIKKLDQDLVKIKNIITDEEFRNKSKKLKEKVKDYNIFKNDIDNTFNQNKESQIKIFFEKINPIIQNYMNDKNIDIIIDKKNIFIARSDYDITTDILELINKNF